MGVTSRWINPNAVPLTQDRFSDNGTFSAAKEGKYGYNKVSVGVEPDRIYGKDPDTDEDVEVREEPEPKDPYRPDEGDGGGGGGGGGEKPPHLVVTVLPSQIAVVKPPDKASYLLGETIEYAGIGVQARLKSGQAWDGFKNGMVPFGELEFPVKKLDDYYIPKRSDYANPNAIPITHVAKIEDAYAFLVDRLHADMPDVYMEDTFRLKSPHEGTDMFARELEENCGLVVTLEAIEAPDWYGRYYPWEFSRLLVDVTRLHTGMTLFNQGYPVRNYILNRYNGEFVVRYQPESADYYHYDPSQPVSVGYRYYEYQRAPNHYRCYELSTINAYLDSPDDIPIYTATSDLDCGIAQPIRYSTRGVAVASEGGGRYRETHFSGGCIALAPRGNEICYITASAGGGSMDIDDRWIDEDAGSESEESETVRTGSSFTHNGLTVRFTSGSVAMDGAIESYLPDTASDGAALLQHAGEIAWTMVYGNVAGADKALPVQWSRPGDGKVLETEFNISVAVPVE